MGSVHAMEAPRKAAEVHGLGQITRSKRKAQTADGVPVPGNEIPVIATKRTYTYTDTQTSISLRLPFKNGRDGTQRWWLARCAAATSARSNVGVARCLRGKALAQRVA